MTNDGWGSKWPWIAEAGGDHTPWPKAPDWPLSKDTAGVPEDWLTHTSDVANSPQSDINWNKLKAEWDKNLSTPILTAFDIGIGERTILTTFENDCIEHKVISQTQLKLQGSNLVDSEQYLYFQCDGCGDILDPHTKSFAKLQEHRVSAGWKCAWNIDGMGYKVYCAKCGELENLK